MKVRIPDSTLELKLSEFQFMMGNLNTNVERGEYLIKHFAKKDPSIVSDEVKSAVFLTTIKMLNQEEAFEPSKTVGEYYHLDELLKIRVGHFIEIMNVDVDEVSMEGSEIVAGCLYRKDWSKDYNEDEILETATYFRDLPLRHAIGALRLMRRLGERLREAYPLLYDDHINEEAEFDKTDEEGRKLYDMVMGLAGNQFINWQKAKNGTLGDAFVYLEELKKERIKQKLNEKNKQR